MQIPEIKQRLTIETVLNHYNHTPDRNNMLKCPFHEEDIASMRIYPDTNSFHCFGCGKNGDAIEFCSLKEGDKHKGIVKSAELCNGAEPLTAKSGVIEPSFPVRSEPAFPNKIFLHELFIFNHMPMISSFRKDMLN